MKSFTTRQPFYLGNLMFKSLENTQPITISKFMHFVVFGIFLTIIAKAYIASQLMINEYKQIYLYVNILIQTCYVICLLQCIKKNWFYTALIIFLFFICVSNFFLPESSLSIIFFNNFMIDLLKGIIKIGILPISVLIIAFDGKTYTLSFLIFLIFFLFCLFLAIFILADYGYRTQRNLYKMGYVLYRILLFTVFVLFSMLIFAYFQKNEFSPLIDITATCAEFVLCITLLLLLPYDIQRIKNLGLDVIEKNNGKIKSSILLGILVLYFNLTASWLRVFIPWGWGKDTEPEHQ